MSAEGFAKLREMALELFPVKDARRALFLFSILPKRLVYSVEVTGEEVRVFAVLHDLSAEKDLKKRPVVSVSMKELCRKTGVGETLLRRRLKRLAKTGWIDIIRPGFKQVNQYRLYESSLADREGKNRLAETARKIRRDRKVQERLSKSIRNPAS
jgi:DNA-binding transcriptional ArsR family regulator